MGLGVGLDGGGSRISLAAEATTSTVSKENAIEKLIAYSIDFSDKSAIELTRGASEGTISSCHLLVLLSLVVTTRSVASDSDFTFS